MSEEQPPKFKQVTGSRIVGFGVKTLKQATLPQVAGALYLTGDALLGFGGLKDENWLMFGAGLSALLAEVTLMALPSKDTASSTSLAKRIAGGLHTLMGGLMLTDGLWSGDWLKSFVGAFFTAGGLMYSGWRKLLPKRVAEKLPPLGGEWDNQQAGSAMYDAGSLLLLASGIASNDPITLGAALSYIAGNNLLKVRVMDPPMQGHAP